MQVALPIEKKNIVGSYSRTLVPIHFLIFKNVGKPSSWLIFRSTWISYVGLLLTKICVLLDCILFHIYPHYLTFNVYKSHWSTKVLFMHS